MASRGVLVIGALWVAGATAATSVGLVAVRLVGNAVGDQVSAPLTTKAVQQALSSAAPAGAPSEVPEGPPSQSSEEGDVRTVSTAGGVVSARCRDQVPALLYATPGDGYRTQRRGTRSAVVVQFVGSSSQVTLTLSCRGEDLLAATRTEPVGTTRTSPPPATTVPVPAPESPSPEPRERPEPSQQPEPSETPEPGDRGTDG
ncbi:MAG: hypothetical protein WCD35_01485 [Mycobacteriales bacterium]